MCDAAEAIGMPGDYLVAREGKSMNTWNAAFAIGMALPLA